MTNTITVVSGDYAVDLDADHQLVHKGMDIGMDWIGEALPVIRQRQAEQNLTEDEAMAVMNEGATWAHFRRATDAERGMDIMTVAVPTTKDEAVEALRWCEVNIGGGFHPDTRGTDYATGSWDRSTTPPTYVDHGATFTPRQAEHYDAVMDAVFGLLDDPYAVAMDLFTELNPDEATR